MLQCTKVGPRGCALASGRRQHVRRGRSAGQRDAAVGTARESQRRPPSRAKSYSVLGARRLELSEVLRDRDAGSTPSSKRSAPRACIPASTAISISRRRRACWIEGVVVRGAGGAGVASSLCSRGSVPGDRFRQQRPTASPSVHHAEVLVNQRLTTRASSKNVRHIELSLAGSNIRYEPGDAIGILPQNAGRAGATALLGRRSSLAATPDEVHLDGERYRSSKTPAVGKQQASFPECSAALEEGAVVPIYVQRNTGFRLPGAGSPDHHDRPGYRALRRSVPSWQNVKRTGARGPQLALLRRAFVRARLSSSNGWLALAQIRRAHTHGRGVLARSGTQGLRAASPAGAGRRDLVVAAGWCLRLRVRRRRAHGAECMRALLEIIERHGGHNPTSAAEYLQQLQRNRRYQRDVY